MRSEPTLIGSLVEAGAEFAIYNWLADQHTDAYAPVELRGPDGQIGEAGQSVLPVLAQHRRVCTDAADLQRRDAALRKFPGGARVARMPGPPSSMSTRESRTINASTGLSIFALSECAETEVAVARQSLRALPFLDFLAPGDRPSAVSRRRAAADGAILQAAARGPTFSRGIGRDARRSRAMLPRDCLIDTQLKRVLRLAGFAIAAGPNGGGRHRTPAARTLPRLTGAVGSRC
jgi:hypothetical protein